MRHVEFETIVLSWWIFLFSLKVAIIDGMFYVLES